MNGRGSSRFANDFIISGFTLIELMVVIAIVGILASLLPALSRAKAQGQKVKCINNFRQLHVAIQLYGIDHNDQLPRNHIQGDFYTAGEIWVGGAMTWDSLGASGSIWITRQF